MRRVGSHRVERRNSDTLVCYALRLRLVEFGDKPEVLKQMAKRALEDASMSGGGGGQKDE